MHWKFCIIKHKEALKIVSYHLPFRVYVKVWVYSLTLFCCTSFRILYHLIVHYILVHWYQISMFNPVRLCSSIWVRLMLVVQYIWIKGINYRHVHNVLYCVEYKTELVCLQSHPSLVNNCGSNNIFLNRYVISTHKIPQCF